MSGGVTVDESVVNWGSSRWRVGSEREERLHGIIMTEVWSAESFHSSGLLSHDVWWLTAKPSGECALTAGSQATRHAISHFVFRWGQSFKLYSETQLIRKNVLNHVSHQSSHLTGKCRNFCLIFSIQFAAVIMPPRTMTSFMTYLFCLHLQKWKWFCLILCFISDQSLAFCILANMLISFAY